MSCQSIIITIMSMIIIGVIDQLHAKHTSARYFCLHYIVNLFFIVPFCCNDLIKFIDNPLVNMHGSKMPVIICNSLHFYHILFFNLKSLDYIHHIPAIIGCSAGYYFKIIPACNVQMMLALMGIPGGIDYFLLTLVKSKKLSFYKEKQINSYLNIWIRAPVANATSFIILYSSMQETDIYQLIYGSFIGLHGYWNANFFMEKVVESFYKYKELNYKIV